MNLEVPENNLRLLRRAEHIRRKRNIMAARSNAGAYVGLEGFMCTDMSEENIGSPKW